MANKMYSPQVKQTALQCYVEGMPLRRIAEDLCVPYGTVHNWHWAEKWTGIRRQMRAQLRYNGPDNLLMLGRTLPNFMPNNRRFRRNDPGD